MALQLLDSAHDAVGRARPGAQGALLSQIGDAYVLFDKKAFEILEQAFSIASSLSGNGPFTEAHSAQLQAYVVRSVSDLNIKQAAEMARSVPPELRASPIETVAGKLMDKGDIDAAIELVNLAAGTKYPFSATGRILKERKDDDPRRAILFGGALSGYQTSADREFGQLVAANWEHLP